MVGDNSQAGRLFRMHVAADTTLLSHASTAKRKARDKVHASAKRRTGDRAFPSTIIAPGPSFRRPTDTLATPVADAFLHALATADLFSPSRATIYTLGRRLMTPIRQSHTGGILLLDCQAELHSLLTPSVADARSIVDNIRSHRRLTSSDTAVPALFQRRDWLWVRDGGSSDSAIRLWSQCSAAQDEFSQSSQLWSRTDTELRALHQQFGHDSSDRATEHYPWVVPTHQVTSRWHSNARIPEELSFPSKTSSRSRLHGIPR